MTAKTSRKPVLQHKERLGGDVSVEMIRKCFRGAWGLWNELQQPGSIHTSIRMADWLLEGFPGGIRRPESL